MKRAIWISLLATLLALPGRAQTEAEPVPVPDDLTAQVAKLNSTLEKVVDLMSQQVENQTLDLLMQRIQLSAERVGQTERDLRAARKQRDSSADEKLQVEEQIKIFEDQAEQGHLEEAEVEGYTQQLEAALERIEKRLRSADREIAELDAALGNQRQDLREWQEFVDQRLSDL